MRRCAERGYGIQERRLRAERDRAACSSGGDSAPQEGRHVRHQGVPLPGLQLLAVGHPAILRRAPGEPDMVASGVSRTFSLRSVIQIARAPLKTTKFGRRVFHGTFLSVPIRTGVEIVIFHSRDLLRDPFKCYVEQERSISAWQSVVRYKHPVQCPRSPVLYNSHPTFLGFDPRREPYSSNIVRISSCVTWARVQ